MRSAPLQAWLLGLLPLLVHAAPRETALVAAIRASDYATVRQQLKRNAVEVNRPLADGSTPLSWAVETQDPRMVELLLEGRARPDAGRNAAASPVLLACEHGNPAVIALLLDARADVRRAGSDGIAPLALCAGTAPVAIVERLLARGAIVDATDAAGQTALMHAAASGRTDNVRALLAAGADVNRVTSNGFSPLFFALKSGHPDTAIAVLDAGADADHVGPEGTTAVQLAMYQSDHAFAARMIERGADLRAFDRNGNTLLHAAVLADQPALVQQLLRRGANPDTPTGASRIEWRYESNFRSGTPDLPSRSPLMLAAERGSAESMRLLAAAGADASFRLRDGTGIVHAAVTHDRLPGNPSALRIALDLQPDANVRDSRGETPLHRLLASDPGPDTEALMRLLAARGARTDLADRGGRTAADVAADAGTATAVREAFQAAFGGPRTRS